MGGCATVGCIEIKDAVFIGVHVTILKDVRIGSNSIVAEAPLWWKIFLRTVLSVENLLK